MISQEILQFFSAYSLAYYTTLYDNKYLSCDSYEFVGWTKDEEARVNPVGDYKLVTDTVKLVGETQNNKEASYSV